MVDEKQKEVLTQILELLDTACQASLELMYLFDERKVEECTQLLQDLRAVICTVSNTGLAAQLEHSCTEEMLENVEDTLEDIERSIQSGDSQRAAMKMEFQLFPFLRQLKEGFYFWGTVYPDKEKMSQYYQQEFAEHYRNFYVSENGSHPIRLSIIVAAYNHLDTTKLCVGQLLKETDFEKLNAELILIDHGSSDGTLEYFEGLGVGKVIHFKKNARMYVFSILSQICQGEFFAFVSNDILVTNNWADILLDCLKSDPKIIAAVPATPNIANLQMLDCPTNDPEKFIRWANKQNKSNPSRWNDRARLMPPLGMYRTKSVSKIGLADPYFYSMEFWDDDFSLRARRAGYRQLVCPDVACYHFGSVTGKEAQKRENTLVYGRDLFLKKNGVDAWGSGFCYDYPAVQLFKQVFSGQKSYAVLCLDCGLGDTPLQIRNELRHLNQECELYQLTSQQEYLADLAPFSNEAFFVSDLMKGLDTYFGERKFDLAYLGRDISKYENAVLLLEAVSNRLTSNGCLIFACRNPFHAVILHAMLQFSFPEGNGRLVLTDPRQIHGNAKKYFSKVQQVPINDTVRGVEAFAAQVYGKNTNKTNAVQQMSIQKYLFVCQK